MNDLENTEIDISRHQTKEYLKPFLFALLGSDELVNKWWVTPNKAFGMKTAIEVLEGSPETVINYIEGFSY